MLVRNKHESIVRADYRQSMIPNRPGVYCFRDESGKLIYVGKAKSLRKRLASYFQASRQEASDAKLRSLINSIAAFEFTVLRNDDEALLLESRLIKEYNPRYNVLLRDDKRFLLIKINLSLPYPKLILTRLKKENDCLYYGPFPKASALRATVDHLNRSLGLRSCSALHPGAQDHKHCHDDIIRHCSAPCMQRISKEAYLQRVQKCIDILQGDTKEIIETLHRKMGAEAEAKNYEEAAVLRDMISNIKSVCDPHMRHLTQKRRSRFPGMAAVLELQNCLDLPTAPQRIECFDISTLSGSFSVGSRVCFVNGSPDKKAYRRYRIKSVQGVDDFAMMQEVVHRRFKRMLDRKEKGPDLLVIDGGLGQLHAVQACLRAFELDRMPLIALAKKQEEIYTLQQRQPLRLRRHQAALKLLQAIRDEAHRFALAYHHERRRRQIRNSILDEIPGIGRKRKQQLLARFRSAHNLRQQTAVTICEKVPGIGLGLAQNILDQL